MASVVITDYSRYTVRILLLTGRKRRRERERRTGGGEGERNGEDMSRKEGEIVEGEGE